VPSHLTAPQVTTAHIDPTILQVESYRPFEVDVRSAHTLMGESDITAIIRVDYAHRRLISDAPLRNWGALVRSSWRVGLGASTALEGRLGEARTIAHTVRALTLRMGAAFLRAEVPFSVSYNAQDFFPASPKPGAAATASFMYARAATERTTRALYTSLISTSSIVVLRVPPHYFLPPQVR